jgi:type II secretory ATPase GspE/PulE/Tfp pilus assembly ATPase PilB-like protein
MDEHIEDFIKLEASNGYEETDSEKMRVEANDPPVVQYVNSLIVQAVNDSASDIHVQPKQESVDLQLRIDGTLYSINSPPKSMLSAIVTRIKIMAHLDIAEHRLPQDGRFKLKVGSSEIDLRVSCFPTIYGESVVMRILNTSSPLNGLEQLGFSAYDLGRFRELIRNAYGLILVTGPTGSGKTTTLYTAINEIKSSDKNIITLEDPVEYRMQDIQQSQVNPGIGFSFARGLRSILRQDPDVIMVGEIRDKETAEIAIHAALTGHLVFSTLHTNDAAGATVRMVNMGVEPFLITSSLLGVLAQRLVRCTCQACKREYVVDKKILEKLSLTPDVAKFYRGEGCKKCLKSGYKGRSGIFELLIPDESMRNLILNRASGEMIKHSARENGMKTLRESGIEKIKSGLTTPEEVLRVTQETGTD